jgi:hypothetical protein
MSKRKKLLVALVGVAVLVLGGIAYALWSADGSGSGTAQARTAADITLAVDTSQAADLYPGFTGGNIYFKASNTNPYGVTFTGWTAGAVVSSDEENCPASLVTVDDSDPISIPVAANASDVQKEIDGVVSLSSLADDGCQGVTFTIPLTLTGSQS